MISSIQSNTKETCGTLNHGFMVVCIALGMLIFCFEPVYGKKCSVANPNGTCPFGKTCMVNGITHGCFGQCGDDGYGSCPPNQVCLILRSTMDKNLRKIYKFACFTCSEANPLGTCPANTSCVTCKGVTSCEVSNFRCDFNVKDSVVNESAMTSVVVPHVGIPPMKAPIDEPYVALPFNFPPIAKTASLPLLEVPPTESKPIASPSVMTTPVAIAPMAATTFSSPAIIPPVVTTAAEASVVSSPSVTAVTLPSTPIMVPVFAPISVPKIMPISAPPAMASTSSNSQTGTLKESLIAKATKPLSNDLVTFGESTPVASVKKSEPAVVDSAPAVSVIQPASILGESTPAASVKKSEPAVVDSAPAVSVIRPASILGESTPATSVKKSEPAVVDSVPAVSAIQPASILSESTPAASTAAFDVPATSESLSTEASSLTDASIGNDAEDSAVEEDPAEIISPSDTDVDEGDTAETISSNDADVDEGGEDDNEGNMDENEIEG